MKLRVWNIINMPAEPSYKPVASVREAYDYINAEANRQLAYDWIETNAFGLEVFNEDDQEWEEWVDEYGGDINEYAQEQGWE